MLGDPGAASSKDADAWFLRISPLFAPVGDVLYGRFLIVF
jgi:hypothetical protein